MNYKLIRQLRFFKIFQFILIILIIINVRKLYITIKILFLSTYIFIINVIIILLLSFFHLSVNHVKKQKEKQTLIKTNRAIKTLYIF